jgi:hypothetical protein
VIEEHFHRDGELDPGDLEDRIEHPDRFDEHDV